MRRNKLKLIARALVVFGFLLVMGSLPINVNNNVNIRILNI
jgi:hypothetical protein